MKLPANYRSKWKLNQLIAFIHSFLFLLLFFFPNGQPRSSGWPDALIFWFRSNIAFVLNFMILFNFFCVCGGFRFLNCDSSIFPIKRYWATVVGQLSAMAMVAVLKAPIWPPSPLLFLRVWLSSVIALVICHCSIIRRFCSDWLELFFLL